MTTTTYTICEYSTGRAVGEIYMTERQYDEYVRDAQWPEGLIRLGDLYGSEKVMNEIGHSNTVVYLEPE